MRPSLPIPDFSGKIDISYFKGISVDVVVDGLFGKPDLSAMSGKDVVDRLSFGNKRCKQIVYLEQALRTCTNAFPGDTSFLDALGMCSVSRVIGMAAFAGLLFGTAGTHIRRLV